MDSNLSSFLHSHPNLKAIAYCRVSTPGQEQEGFSLSMQSEIINKFAKDNGIEIIKEYQIAESAFKPGRTKFGLVMKQLLENKRFNSKQIITVLVDKSDRFFRNIHDYSDFTREGFTAIEVRMGELISDDMQSTKKMFTLFNVAQSQYSSDKNKEDVKRGVLGKAKAGYWPYKPKFGYRSAIDDQTSKKTMIPDTDRAPLVTRMFMDFSDGDISIKELARKYREFGLRMKKSGKALSPAQLHRILRDSGFAGKFSIDGIEFEATKYRPLVSMELWLKVQAVLDERSKTKKKDVRKKDFAYSSLMQCAHCGLAISEQEKIKKSGKHYRYLHCTQSKGKHQAPYIREERLDQAISQVLKRLKLDSSVLDLMVEAYSRKHSSKGQQEAKTSELLERRLVTIDRSLGILLDKLLDKTIDDADYRKKVGELKNEKLEVTQSLQNQRSFKRADVLGQIPLPRLLELVPSIYPNQTPSTKRRFLRLLIQKARMNGDGLHLEFRPPFDRFIAPAVQEAFKNPFQF